MFSLSTATKVRIARMLYLFLRLVRTPFRGRDLVSARRHGIVWDLDLREGIDLTIYALGAFERDTLKALESLVQPGATVLDIGANMGAHTLHLARLVGEKGRVIAFEPTDFAIAKLRANLKANPALEPRVEVHQAFLVADAAATPLVSAVASSWPVDGSIPDNEAMGSRAMGVSGAAAMTVDGVLAASGDPVVQLIKMDVDGHELEVLEGARQVLIRCHPVIVMELAPYVFQPASNFDTMVRVLTELNYVFVPLGSTAELPSDPARLRSLIPRLGSVNVVALPTSAGTRE
ncbi:MAG: FkbM family methyltransferase [Vicinamibacteria bacterium]|jgi:FkbM family methyltransferase|nr:FkbM family methyltransferase [Vicinamibacteria bacterium]